MKRHSPEEMARLRAETQEQFKHYLTSRALGRLGASGHHLEVTVRPPRQGLGSLLFLVECDQLPPLVLRGGRDVLGLRRRAAGHGLLLAYGVPAPEILLKDLGPVCRWRYGYNFLVERQLPGLPFDELATVEGAGAVGRTFAKMHQHTASHPGRAGEIRWPWRNVGRWMRRRARAWVRRYRQAGGPAVGRLQQLWEEADPSWADHRARLCMGDVAPNNVLVTPEGAVSLIDLSGVGFTSAPFELVRLKDKLLGADEQLWEAFWEGYTAVAPDGLRAEVEQALPVLRVLFHARQYGRMAPTHPPRERHRVALEGLLGAGVG